MTDQDVTLQQLVDIAIGDLKDWAEENPECNEPHDTIHEIADSSTPVYTYDILKIGADNWQEIALVKPELGPAFDGEPTPVNIMAANIYEHVEGKLWEWWN